jgi:CheY-like chemotaxis protein
MLFPHSRSGAGNGDRDDVILAPVILVVEDNPVMQRVALMHLEELGYRVETAVNGVEAVTATERANYDLILMDCHMDQMDGYEATKRIRENDAVRGTHTTIVALTTQSLAGDREKCLQSGMDDYMRKPVSKNQMKKMLDKWLAGRTPPRCP